MYMAPAFPHDQWMIICLITASFHCIPTKSLMKHLMVWCVLNVYTIYIIYLYSFQEQRILDPVFVNAPPHPWLRPKHSLFVLYCFNSKGFLGPGRRGGSHDSCTTLFCKSLCVLWCYVCIKICSLFFRFIILWARCSLLCLQ